MSCCGKNIIKGYLNLALNKKSPSTDKRIRTCQNCTENTWWNFTDYSSYVIKHFGEYVTHLDRLEELPPLPRHGKSKENRKLFCSICKCFIPAKARVADEKCPKDKWNE